MTVREIEKRLSNAGIDEAAYEARLIGSHFSGKSTARLLAEPDTDISGNEVETFVRRRCERYPLQYLFGEWEFSGMTFALTEDCLIPRADSEILAEAAARRLKKGGAVLDLCTGTGCILAAVLKLSGNTRGTAVELYPKTAEVARKNLARLGFDCEVITGDATTDLFPPGTKFDVITANPPYVTADEMKTLDAELYFEPRTALTDGGDGLSIIRDIIKSYRNHLADGGVMLIEHGAEQAEAVREIARENGMESETLKDYGGHDRVAVITKIKQNNF